ncbi:LytR/AlgR family response regulator transcription factor [Flavobacterium psychrotrophum]|uniref:LytR/AlgR family response regulator transcription factor n=1 Tax=Flavobacterium psychrotrophum TaxID=2294119 RepID=UPI000E30C655|nr:LytTR family DNA-binding domain-containing protein [Flavobacterium psychrotrophum]
MGTTYRCLIIDDETPAHKALSSHISKYADLEHTASAYSGKEALRLLSERQFDIIFLDINMPVISGVELMELQPVRPLTIVTTAYSDYAMRAFELDVVDYLLKPIALEKFEKAVDKAKAFYKYSIEKQHSKNGRQQLKCKHNGENINISFDEIIYIESLGNYIKVHCKNSVPALVLHGTLSGVLKELDSHYFLRIHRAYIVNKSYITLFQNRFVEINNIVKLPVGRKYQLSLENLE